MGTILNANGAVSVGVLGMQINILRKQMNGMQLEFADMLKLTIDKMHEKLEQAYAAGA